MKNLKIALKELQEEKPGLWANIRAKRARGEKPSHGNSNAHKDAVKAGKKINENKNSLEYLNSITKKAPFNPPQYLYHLSAPENIDSILKTGLKPGKPEASLHGGKIKGEEFSGVWLTPINDVYEIVDTHFLPEEFYNGKILQIDTSGLNKDRFSIGIEYNLMKPPFTKQEYLDKTEEIIYLDAIPPSAISILQENYADGKVKGKSRPGRVKKSGASCNGSVTDLRRKAKNASGEKAKMYHWCANMKSGRKK